MTGSQSPSNPHRSGDALRVELAVRHPECWLIDLSSETQVGILGRGVYHTADRLANSHVTLFSDQQTALDEAVETARASGHTFSVAEMTHDHEHDVPVSPGKSRRELLVEHDPTKQVSDAFVSRGFVYGAPVDIRDGVEHWTLLTHNDRHAIQTALDEVRDLEAAQIELIGIAEVDSRAGTGTLPLSRLSARQREVFQLARQLGYYVHPKTATAADLAEELDVTTSTVHEHLHKAEQKLLDLS
jgi:predicted DNA binding protein